MSPDPTTASSNPEARGTALHLGIAEQGKLCALKGDHPEALRHYREALRLAVAGKDSEVFFRHYTECVLESLEHLGHYDEILSFCERAEAHYAEQPPAHELAWLDRATHHQRRGVVLLKQGRVAEAREALEEAVATAPSGHRLPLTDQLLRWLQAGMRLDARRITAEQRRHGLFIVRADQVDRSRAIALPPGVGMPPVPGAAHTPARSR